MIEETLGLKTNGCDHPVAASDAVKCKKQTTATRRASLCSHLGFIAILDAARCFQSTKSLLHAIHLDAILRRLSTIPSTSLRSGLSVYVIGYQNEGA